MKRNIGLLRRKIMNTVSRLLPLKNIIIFESNPDYTCNTYPVFLYLREKLPNYKLIWWVKQEDEAKPEGVDDVIFHKQGNLRGNLKHKLAFLRAKAVICCNHRYPVYDNPKQISLFLCHGSKTKKTRGTYEVGFSADYINVQSHFFDDVITYEYNCKPSQLVYLGYPRCDYLFQHSDLHILHKLFGIRSEKYMIWLPTVRRFTVGRTDAQNTPYDNIGMPLLYSIDMLHAFNDFLRSIELHIIYKPHPVQDVSMVLKEELSHIHIIFDKDLQEKGLQLYEVIAQSEALITDYSSVFFDYLLLDRPIATTTDDIESWKSGRGFAFDLEAMYDKATERIPDIAHLQDFILEVLGEKDAHREGRREVRDLTNIYQDGNSAARVGDFILERMDTKPSRILSRKG